MHHRSRVSSGPGIAVTFAIALTWLLIAAAAWSLPEGRQADDSVRVLEDVRVHLAAGRLEQALALADRLDVQRLRGPERAELKRMIGYAEARRGRYAEALSAYQSLLEEGSLLDRDTLLQTHYAAAQLCFALGRYQDAVTHLQIWQTAGSGDRAFAPYILLGQAYFKVHAYQDAIRSMEAGLARADGEGAEIREHWLQLLHHLYVEQQQWQDAAAVLERLTLLYPKPEYEELLTRTRARG